MKTDPVDWILELYINPENEKTIKGYTYFKGRFEEEYTFKEGSPIKETSKRGKDVYIVNNIDKENKEVVAPELGEYNDIEFLSKVETIEANRLRNRKLAKAGGKALRRLRTIADRMKAKHYNRNQKKDIEMVEADPEMILDEVEAEIPELLGDSDEDEDDTSIQKILREVESPQDEYNASLEFSTGSGGESDE
ncbi:MAG: hypothetical protein H8Z69_03900 [Nanohaloarchaea archaeon]|nr:hypothetical protein [Candidatus Nanohaloarchaea archaeon]